MTVRQLTTCESVSCFKGVRLPLLFLQPQRTYQRRGKKSEKGEVFTEREEWGRENGADRQAQIALKMPVLHSVRGSCNQKNWG